MTGLLHEQEFSRKTFVKGGGALIVGFSLLGSAFAGRASAADDPFASDGVDQFQIDSWITINADNTATIKTGGIRQGTGSDTGLLMIAGEELDMEMSQLKFIMADTGGTGVTPNTGEHAASNTIKNTGAGVRGAAATAKQALLGLASTRLGVPTSQLSVSGGVVSGGGKSVSYGDLVGGKLLNVTMPASWDMNPAGGPSGSFNGPTPAGPGQGILAGTAPAKPVSQYKLVGATGVPRIDIPAIVTGSEGYIQGIRVPGMLHGRVVRPRGQTVFGFGAPIVSVDESSIKHIPNVQIVRKGDFLGVVAPHEYDAIQAAAQLKVKWADAPAVLPGGGNEFQTMRALAAAGKVQTVPNALEAGQGMPPNRGDVDAALASAAHVVSGEYGFPTTVHCPIGPSAAVADVTPNGARIFSGTQGPYQTRPVVANAIGLPENRVHVTAVAMSGVYGHTQYDDTAAAAAVMSQAVGAPVRLQLMRWDEIGWDTYGPAALMDVRAGIDSHGNLLAIDFTNIVPQWASISNWPTSAWVGKSKLSSFNWLAYAPGPMYNLPNQRYTLKAIEIMDNWIAGGWMRSVQGHAVVFAGEQVIDELAHAAKMDPVAFRIKNAVQGNDFTQAQHRDQLLALLNAVTKAANWQPRVSASNLSDANVVRGRGVAWQDVYNPMAMAQTAAVADVEVNKKTGKVTVKHVYQALSGGLAVYPDGVTNQIVGGTTQAVSWTLTEQLRMTKTNVASTDFVSYPILRFKDAPEVTPILIQWDTYSDTPYTAGIGESPVVVVPAAIANAFYDATGVRMRTAPFTPARVRAALKEAAVA